MTAAIIKQLINNAPIDFIKGEEISRLHKSTLPNFELEEFLI